MENTKEFKLNIDPNWLLYMVEKEYNCDISVGCIQRVKDIIKEEYEL